jgi:YD repeat-containing protein
LNSGLKFDRFLDTSPTPFQREPYWVPSPEGSGHLTSPKGRQSTYGYDWLGRRTTTSDPDTGASSSTYDNNGNTLTSTDARGTTVATDYGSCQVK